MADLIAITYENEETAEQARKRVLELQKEYLISLEDIVVVVKDSDGKIKLNQMFNATAAGAASGSFWGFLVGLVFMMPIAGVLIGAASGALGGKLSDFGINDEFMKGVAGSIKPGNAALFVLIKKMTDRQGAWPGCSSSAARCCAHPSTRPRKRNCATRSTSTSRPRPRADRPCQPT